MSEEAHEKARHALTGAIVDVDLFAGGTTLYRISDVEGTEHRFEISNDPPLPQVLGLMRVYDLWAAADMASDEGDKAWSDLIGALSRLIASEVGATELVERFGAGALTTWVSILITRFQMAASGLGMGAFLQQLLEGGEDGPKVVGTASSKSSASSEAETAGPTTTGAPSAGASSGPASASRPS